MSRASFLALCLAAAASPALAQNITIGGQTGSQVFLPNNEIRIYNFGVTDTGAGENGLLLSALKVQMKGGNSASNVDPVTVKIYSGLGGTGTVLATANILASQLNNQFSVIDVGFTPINLAAGGYSVVLSTTNANTYYIKQGALFLSDTQGVTLTAGNWVQDSNETGTATTSLTAASNVLAQASLGTNTVAFGNFRVGSTRTQSVSLANSALATSNNVTEELTITSSAANAPASVSGLPGSSLAQGASTNFTVALNTATAGVRNGTVTLNYGSIKGSSASTTTGTTSVGSDTINVTGTGYRAAVGSVSSSSVNLGNFRVGATNVTGTTTVNNTATNDGYSEGLTLAASGNSGGATAANLAGLVAAGGNKSITVGLSSVSQAGANNGAFTLGYTTDGTGTSGLASAGVGSQQINVTAYGYRAAVGSVSSSTVSLGNFRVGTTNVTGTINVTAYGYRAAAASVASNSVDLGKFHVGASGLLGSTGVTNTSVADGYSESLALSQSSVSGGASVSNLGTVAAGATRNIGVGLASVSAVGANTGSVTLGVVSSGSGTSSLSDLALANQVINVSATGYSGQSVWSVDANGVWNSFDGWDGPGGKPGVDGGLSVQDSATFGTAATSARTITLGAAIPTLRSLTFDNGAASYYIAAGGAGRLQLGTAGGDGTVSVASGTHTVSAGIEFAQYTTATIATGSRLLLSGALTGSAALVKNGTGRLDIDGTGSFSGVTNVEAGLLNVNGSIASSEVNVGNGGTLGGSGTVGGTTIETGGTLAPGNSPGTLNVSGDLTWASGGNYNWQIVNASGTAGSGWDLVDISGDLDLSFLSAESPFAINLWTLSSTGPDVDGAAINFNNQESYTWTIARVAGSIIGFDASYFTLNLGANNGTAGWANDLGGGSIAIVQNGQDLDLVFTAATPVPEPSTYGLLLGAGALALAAARRRRKA